MTEYMTEQEQIEQLKNWVKQYGMTVLTGVLIAAACLFGWHSWQQHQNKTLASASYLYDNMLDQKNLHLNDKAKQSAQQLIKNYTHTPYAQLAALLMANFAVNEKKYEDAIERLDWVGKQTTSDSIKNIAILRTGRILLFQNKKQEALKLLDRIQTPAFATLKNALKGDIYLSLNDPIKARNAYQTAITAASTQDVTEKALLQMKIDNLTTVSDLIS